MSDPRGREPGPSLAARWSMAAPLLASSLAGVPVGLVALHAWLEHLSDTAERRAFSSWQVYPFGKQFQHDFSGFFPVYGPVIAIAAILMFAVRRRIPLWSRIAPIPTVLTAISISIVSPQGAHKLQGWQGFLATWPLAAGAVGIAAAWGLARLAVLTLTRNQTGETAGGHLEVPIEVRGAEGIVLSVGRTELTLLGLASSPDRLTIALSDVTLVQAGTLSTDASWTLPNAVSVALPAGDGVRIVTAEQQWVLGVDDAATTVRLIKARMERQGAPRVPVSQAQWEAARRRLGADRRQRSRASRYAWSTGGRNAGLVVGIICAAITALTFTSFGHPWRSSNLLGSAFYGLVSLAAFSMYYQNRRTYRMMERYPRQPGAEPWGNVSESTAPVAGWSNLTVL